MGVLDNVKLQFEDGKNSPVKIKKEGLNSAVGFIKNLLAVGFRNNVFYYRDNDRRLILKVWEHEGLVLTKEQRQKFMEITSAGHITRTRRALRAEYPESERVMEKRFHLFQEKREEFSSGDNWLSRRLRRIS